MLSQQSVRARIANPAGRESSPFPIISAAVLAASSGRGCDRWGDVLRLGEVDVAAGKGVAGEERTGALEERCSWGGLALADSLASSAAKLSMFLSWPMQTNCNGDRQMLLAAAAATGH